MAETIRIDEEKTMMNGNTPERICRRSFVREAGRVAGAIGLGTAAADWGEHVGPAKEEPA